MAWDRNFSYFCDNWRKRKFSAVQTAQKADPTFGSLTKKQPVTSGDSDSGLLDRRTTNTIATNHEASPGSLVLASSALEPATVASGVVPQLLPTRAGMLVKLTSTTTVASDCNIYTRRPRPTPAVAETNRLIPPDVNQLVRDMLQYNTNLEKERTAAEKQRQ